MKTDGSIFIVGIDCAAQEKKVGVALGFLDSAGLTASSVHIGVSEPSKLVADFVEKHTPILLALDAPLGWPASLGESLSQHTASKRIPTDAHQLFRRDTDRFIKKNIGKQSLDVGADRIARTAWAAVDLLGRIRDMTGLGLPMAWSERGIGRASCIEVYPAATLEAHGLSSRGYKGNKPEHATARNALVQALVGLVSIPVDLQLFAVQNDDALDALICLLSAADFLRGAAMPPENLATAEKESWIWVRQPL